VCRRRRQERVRGLGRECGVEARWQGRVVLVVEKVVGGEWGVMLMCAAVCAVFLSGHAGSKGLILLPAWVDSG
jgi:hypothetical protein